MAQHYPSLIVVLNSQDALWYTLENHTVHSLEAISNTEDTYSDREGMFFKTGPAILGGEPDVRNARDKEHLRKHMASVIQMTEQLYQEGNYVHVCMMLPKQMYKAVCAAWRDRMPDVPILFVFGNFTHASAEQIRFLFSEALKPPAHA